MRKFHRIALMAALAVAFPSCIFDDGGRMAQTGGGSEVVTVTAAFTQADGSPARAASVHLRSRLFLPDTGSAPGTPVPAGFDAVTDSSGRMRIDSVPRGNYFLEAVLGDSQGVRLACILSGDTSVVTLGIAALAPTGTVSGIFLPPSGFPGRTYVQLYGSDRQIRADSATGAFRLAGLPGGTYMLRGIYSNPVVDPLEINVRTVSGDISNIGTLVLASFENENYSAWPHARRITLNTTPTGADVAGNADNFPLLVRLNAGNFDFSQSVGQGRDVRFSDGFGQRLRYEIERWDSAAAQAEIWVRLDRVDGNSAVQFLTLHWGLANVPGWSDGRRVFGVDNDFRGVWHLGEEAPDTTAKALYRDAVGINPGDDHIDSTDQTGVIGHGHAFNGTDYIVVPVADGILKPAGRITVSAWFRSTKTGSNAGSLLSMGDNYILRVTSGGGGYFSFFDGQTVRGVDIRGTLLDGAWHHLAGDFDGTVVRVYQDGKLAATANVSGPIPYNLSPNFLIGRHGTGKPGFEFYGNIDEAEVSSGVSRTADWIKLSYESQRPGSKLLTFGP